ncbi:MAG: hypothetical protein K1V99_05960 [Bacteroidales bacterium]|nr:hypothetical protein [Bacteroidales bacterium]
MEIIINNEISFPDVNPTSNSGENVSMFTFNDGDLNLIGRHNHTKGHTIFAGISSCNTFSERITGKLFDKTISLLIRAINNRTIERNYFKLYSELLDRIITEDEFDKELNEHESEYVISNDISPTKEELELVLKLIPHIKDVTDSEDLSSLFSFKSNQLDKLLLQLENNNGNI